MDERYTQTCTERKGRHSVPGARQDQAGEEGGYVVNERTNELSLGTVSAASLSSPSISNPASAHLPIPLLCNNFPPRALSSSSHAEFFLAPFTQPASRHAWAHGCLPRTHTHSRLRAAQGLSPGPRGRLPEEVPAVNTGVWALPFSGGWARRLLRGTWQT